MSINFDRQRGQLRCEGFLSCTTPEQWANASFKTLSLTKPQASLLMSDLKLDAVDLYFKGILSLFEALRSIDSHLFSWATIKIYYSLFYFLKSYLASNGTALVRQKSLYYLHALEGESPVSKNNKKYNTDHSGTIYYFSDLHSTDILLSQQIDFVTAHEWLMARREQVNYRERTFNEPNHSSIWEDIVQNISQSSLKEVVLQYVDDNYLLTFQEEHGMLAIPLKRVLLTKAKLDGEGVALNFSQPQKDLLRRVLPFSSTETDMLFN